MAVKQVKYNDTYIYINDEVDDKETGIKLDIIEDNDNTKVIEPIDLEESLEKTKINILGDNNE